MRLAFELARELVRRGHEVTAITTDVLDDTNRHGAGGKGVQDIEGVKAVYMKNLSNRLAYSHQLFLPMRMKKALGELDFVPDIIHMHGHRHLLNNLAGGFAVKKNIPYVMTANGTAPNIERKMLAKRIFDKLFGDKVLRDAAGFVAVSKAEIAQYNSMGIDKDKVQLIYNGIDLEVFNSLPQRGRLREKLGIGADDTVVLYMGKITPRKGVEHLVDAVALEPGWKLIIAGNDMGHGKVVKEKVRALGIEDRVYFTGLLVEKPRLSAYVDADVCVYPSTLEIFGLVPFEAILCGTPVVVSDDCGCGEIINEEKAGRTVPYADPEALRQAIMATLSNSLESKEMVKRGKNFIEKELSWATIAGKTEEFYEKVAGSWQGYLQ